MYGLKAFTRDEFIRSVKKTIEEYSLIKEGDTVIAALSGGADSVAMTAVLSVLSQEMGFRVVAAHLNHMIRGDEALRDEEFAKKISNELGIEFRLRRRNIPKLSEGKNCEETGREERYKFFGELSAEYKNAKIAVAHNLNDLAETVIMRLARGTSAFGLSGIKIQNGNIIRPLLYMRRDDIEAFLARVGVSFMTDSTNLLDEYTRNKIRHSVMPTLEKINPNASEAVSRTAKKAALVTDFIEKSVKNDYGDITDKINLERFLPLHRAQQEYIVSQCAYKVGVKEISDGKIAEVIDLCGKESGKKILLSGRAFAQKIYGQICFLKAESAVGYKIKLHMGNNYIKEAGYTVTVEESKKGLDLGKVKLPLYAMPAAEGDAFTPVGMNGEKKISRLYIDAKLPVTERRAYPIIWDEEKIVFAMGRASKLAASDAATEKAITIKITKGELI